MAVVLSQSIIQEVILNFIAALKTVDLVGLGR